MKKGLMLLTVTAMLSMLALSGCGSKEAEKPADPPKTEAATTPKTEEKKVEEPKKVENFEISLRHVNVLDTAKPLLELLKGVVAKTEADVPGLKINLDGVDDTTNRDVKLKAEMQAGTQPPIFNLFGGADTQTYSKAGRLLPLNDILAEVGLADSFFNTKEFEVDGKIYGLPEAGYIEGFFFNKKIFDDNGLTAPKTWDELITVSETLKSKGITPIAMGAAGADAWVPNMILNSLFVGYGGMEIQEGFATGATKWTDPAVVKAFEKMQELMTNGYIDKNALGLDYAAGQANYYTGKAAMLFDGSWAITSIVGETSTVKDVTSFFRFPDVGGPGDGTLNGGFSNGYGFSANLKENELTAVKAFIKNFYTLDNQKANLLSLGKIPAMKGITDMTGANDLIKGIGESQGSAKATWPAYDALVTKDVKLVVEKAIQQVMAGKSTPQEATELIQKTQDASNAK